METQEDTVFEVSARSDDVFASLLPRLVASKRPQSDVALVHTTIVATLLDFDLQDNPVVRASSLLGGERLIARTTVALERSHRGRSVVVLCENGDPRSPIIMGVIEQQSRVSAIETSREKRAEIQSDGERRVITAEREIVLRCGDASITLTRAGKVIIKGKYVISRSSGYNKIKGAAVDIN